MGPSNEILLRFFFLTSVTVVTAVSSWLSRRYRHHFFGDWSLAYLFFLLAGFADAAMVALGTRSMPLFAAGSAAIVLSALFFARVGFEIRERAPAPWLGKVAGTVFVLSLVLRHHFSYAAGIGVPSGAFTLVLLWLGWVFLSQPFPSGKPVARILAGLLFAKSLWALAYPALVDTSFEWTGYWLDGVFHLLIGMAMLVFVLERSAGELQLLVEGNVHHSFFLANPRGEIVSWNSGGRRLHGFEDHEVVGRPLSTLLAEDEGAGAAMIAALQDPDCCPEHEGWYRRRDGRRFWARVSFSPIRDGRGGLRGLAVLVHDLSDRRALEQERARLSAAVEQSAESLVIMDAEGRVEYVNPAFERTHGISADALVGRRLEPADLGGEVEGLAEAMERRERWSGRVVRRRDSRAVVEDLVLSPVAEGAQTATMLVLRIHDVSREAALQEQVQHARRMEEMGRLSGGIAHEFGNLVAIIVSYNHLLKDRAERDEEVRTSVEAIARATNRADRLIRELLSLGRPEARVAERVELNDFVAQLAGMLRRILGASIEIHTALAPGTGCIRVDPEQLEQAVTNLALNARDAMPGGGTLFIETRAVTVDGAQAGWLPEPAPGSYVELTLRDTGEGMSEEVRSRIFEPFFTTKPVGRGTGIGLSVAEALVREAKGAIRVESAPGRGTAFALLFPAVEPAAGGDGAPTVLVVDDEPLLGQMVRQILEDNGLRSLAAASAAEALELSRSHEGRIDLLLTDVKMPGMSGDTLGELLRGLYPDLKVLLMSGHVDDPVVRRVRESGARFLAKPFAPEKLLHEVLALIGTSPDAGEGDRDGEAPRRQAS